MLSVLTISNNIIFVDHLSFVYRHAAALGRDCRSVSFLVAERQPMAVAQWRGTLGNGRGLWPLSQSEQG